MLTYDRKGRERPENRCMRTWAGACLSVLLLLAPVFAGADDARERQLELDVQQLRRELLAQARRIDELERQSGRGVKETSVTMLPVVPVRPPWLVAANWERVHAGMSEAEVKQVLGTPTTVRDGGSEQSKIFLYALEVAPEAYLAGSVQLDNGKVTEVKKPVLR
jgi:hypothetical protein